MPFRKLVLSIAALLLASASLALAQGTYTQIDYPGAIYTAAYGINAAGDIVGVYKDTDSNRHGFLLSAALYTTIEYPGALDTYALGINNLGQIVGIGDNDGFLYEISTQTFTTVSYPKGTQTSPAGINDSGMISGYVGVVRNGDDVTIGFEWEGGPYRRILPSGFFYSSAWGINNLGEVVLQAYEANQTFTNLIYSHGKYQVVEIPAPQASAVGINDEHALVGLYVPSPGTAMGFLYQNGSLQSLVFADSTNTFASGVNDAGEVVGTFDDASGNVHGFTWTPPAAAAKK